MFFRKCKLVCKYWAEDSASQMGAALAYYTLFSFAPLLIIAISIAGMVYGGDQNARTEVVQRMQEATDSEEVAKGVEILLGSFHRPPAGRLAPVIGAVTLVFGALGVFAQLRTSLNRIWRVDPPDQGFVIGFVKHYLLAFMMVLVFSIFILLLLSATTVLNVVLVSLRGRVDSVWFWRVCEFASSTVLLTLLFAFTFRFMSDGRIAYSQVMGGAFVSAILFTVGKLFIAMYIVWAIPHASYGAAGSIVVFLVWVYYSSQILFFGAEIIRVRLGK